MNEINMEWYRTFYWTARMGSLSRAAEQLHITQPAISHTLKQLEQALGGPLFFRSAKGVSLTAEGEVVLQYVEQAFNLIASGEKRISDMRNLDDGEIRIGAGDTLSKHYLLPFLEKFHNQYPNIRIHVTNQTTPETLQLLKEGKMDIGIVNLPVEDRKIEFKQSLPQQDCLVGGKVYAELSRRLQQQPLALEQLHEYPLIMLEPGGSTRQFLDRYATAGGVQLKPELELGSMDLLIQFAMSGFGLAFVTRNYVEQELARGELVEIPLTPAPPERHIGIAILRGVPLTSASKRFMTLLPIVHKAEA
ncbi:LysR family transcriptional regulator [Paenibacillus sp. OV219]|uniref:LysR family transcriptional regulator n=1 Tax=Paenibacillus sp. OV219 TaxID=1884377 RepID=UPI0008BD10B5|nr:LysR family transcriptional regulator [Paenibacillus sp. OV219]SEM73069.1 DNA-binding transcriptional regulator, LysR family [Paenibacillus sp. OV219]